MSHKLTIIMPCYNCSATLKEAVDSIYTQDLQIPFEVVMVDDASTDQTWELMQKLSKEHREIRLFQHDKNLGGGASRNTAVAKSDGDFIFCLDGDDVLPPNMMQKLINYLDEKKCDGVVFEESRFFTTNTHKINGIGKNNNVGRLVNISDLFDGGAGPLTTVNFLYTKDAFETVGGYTQHHGFDTQDFGCKFLAKGLSAFICPGSYYFHRQGFKNRSYFERVYASGEYSINTYLIYENILHLFSKEIRAFIIAYDIFENSKLVTNNLGSELAKHYAKNKNNFFVADLKHYLVPNGEELFVEKIKDSLLNEDLFCSAVYLYRQKRFKESLVVYQKLLSQGLTSKILYFNVFRANMALVQDSRYEEIERNVLQLLRSFKPKKQKINLRPNFFVKLLIKIRQAVKDYRLIK